MKNALLVLAALNIAALFAAPPLVTIEKRGAERTVVTLETTASTPAGKAFNAALARNLALSGEFVLAPNGAVRITGTPGADLKAEGKGKALSSRAAFDGEKDARMAARRFADAIVENFGGDGAKGFALNRLVFVNRLGSDNADLYTCFADGFDLRCISREGHAAVGPRWAPNGTDIYYTGFFEGAPLVYRIDTLTGKRTKLAPFKGLATGAAISPDGARAAIVLSFQGNPELYIMDLAQKSVRRITRTKGASEASPCWSPDGTRIAYVSDETRQPQIYIHDVASGKSSRFTRTGTQNTNPAWSARGELAWATKRGGLNYIAVADAATGEGAARLVTDGGTWEHPAWMGDSRHLVASRDKALFMVDASPDADTKPVRVFHNEGNWITPDASR